MKKISLILASLSMLLGGCSLTKPSEPLTFYDLGTLRAAQSSPSSLSLPPLGVAEANSPAWMDSPKMFYRLAYVNEQQPHTYASSRWNMAPAQLFEQRLKSHLGQAGGMVLSASNGAMRVPILYVEVDEFIQVFENPAQSAAHVTVRVAVIDNRILIAQRTFMKQLPAPSADAQGGVRALADASDAVIADMMTWLARLPLKR